jgi:glycosyltransferase involved in cell wall biosynthesis
VRILHVSQYCHAGSVGGTERYLLELVRGLERLGVESRIGWPSVSPGGPFAAEGVAIEPLPSSPMRVDAPPPGLHSAARDLLDRFRPDVLHFHTFGRGESAIAAAGSRIGIPFMFTYHSPGWTCRREDLLIWGGEAQCDGEVRMLRCSACKLQQRLGGPPLVGYLGALASAPLDWVAARSSNLGIRRRLCFLSDTREFASDLRGFLQTCALSISCSEWGVSVLIRNGADAERVKVIPQGVPEDFVVASELDSRHHDAAVLDTRDQASGPFTIAYVGRVTPVKGVDILAKAFTRVPGEDLRLVIHGMARSAIDAGPLDAELRQAALADRRIQLHPTLPLGEVAKAYGQFDLVAIPSVTLETGPLVLFEALQMGVPVFGSNKLGHLGLLESVGMVVTPNDVAGWQAALDLAAREFRSDAWAARLRRVRSMPKLPTMADVAMRMQSCYLSLKR